ncbi:hypothetical protein [Methyloglobulus sp.]|uniref:hypothetical protein n=1 Tax=Methyloglobulus sp. TaxID=2518622 RepID=UPI0032B869FF
MTTLVRIAVLQMWMMFVYYTQLGLVFAYLGSLHEAQRSTGVSHEFLDSASSIHPVCWVYT